MGEFAMVIRIASGLALAAAIGLGSPRSIDEGVKFKSAPLAKGAHAVVTAELDTKMTTAVKVQGIDAKTEVATRTEFAGTVDVVAADKDAAVEATIKIDHDKTTYKIGVVEQGQDSPGAGTSWSATRKGESWKFAGKDGKAPDGELAKVLEDVASRLLGKAALATTLDGKTLKIGEKLAVDAGVAKRLFVYFGTSTAFRSLDLELKSAGKEGGAPVAVFAVKAVAIPDESAGAAGGPPGDIVMKLEGEIAVDTDNLFVLRGALTGPLSLTGKAGDGDAAVNVSGSGEATWKYGVALH
jgi:hypothetical protein